MGQSRSKTRSPTETEFIAEIRSRSQTFLRGTRKSGSALRLGIGDDCAIVRTIKSEEIVVTTDFSLEDVHFQRDWHSPESVGHRCLARGLSDLAAMGARPVAAFLSLAVPKELLAIQRGKSWTHRFLDGFMALANKSGVPLAGGDTARAPQKACFDITVLGVVKHGRAWLRSAAKARDSIYVTGSLGGASAELLALQHNPKQFAALRKAKAGHPHLYPQPRLLVAQKLAAIKGVHAAIDVSDGLSTDLVHICEESGLSAEIEAAAIPVHRLAINAEHAGWTSSALELALHGGEDYELLFTASPVARIPQTVAGVKIHRIGSMTSHVRGAVLSLWDKRGRRSALNPRGWEHFR
jgi:thiamine-monophosphate kinase